MKREIGKIKKLALALDNEYPQYRVAGFVQRCIAPEKFHVVFDDLAGHSATRISIREVGRSFEERPIRIVSVGRGATHVLLWSQMHGDEPTATMAIADILNYVSKGDDSSVVKPILSKLSLHILPVLNPDGAARFQRRTAQGIDMNRDALALRTPEARILKGLQKEIRPAFGFNLHDQELSTIGSSKELTAIALLAPAVDARKTENDTRRRARLLASVFAGAMHALVPGKTARYDDAFEPRAFGDSMQTWGTSTILVESGHAMDDPMKDSIRRLNFVGILTSLAAIASGGYLSADTSYYDELPANGKRAYDVIIRNVRIDHGSGRTTEADLGISYQVDTHSEEPPRLVDLGDLNSFVGLMEMDANGKAVPYTELEIGKPFEWKSWLG